MISGICDLAWLFKKTRPSKVHQVNTISICTGTSPCKNYWNFVKICAGSLLEICLVGLLDSMVCLIWKFDDDVVAVFLKYCHGRLNEHSNKQRRGKTIPRSPAITGDGEVTLYTIQLGLYTTVLTISYQKASNLVISWSKHDKYIRATATQ